MSNLFLSLYELIYLGVVLDKPIQAIPNTYSELSPDEASEFRQAAMDSLLAKGLLCMDFDGELSISDSTKEYLHTCLECDGYYLINCNRTDGSRTEEVVWRKGNDFMLAVVSEGEYAFFQISATELFNMVQKAICAETVTRFETESVQVTQFVLRKAKKALNQGNMNLAITLLMQSGAKGDLLTGIIDALSDKANLITVACVDLKPGNSPITHLISQGQKGYIKIVPIIDNFRSAAVFSFANHEALKKQIFSEVQEFVSIEQ